MRRITTDAQRLRHRLKRAAQRAKRAESDQLERFKLSALLLMTVKPDGTKVVTYDGRELSPAEVRHLGV